MRVLVFVIFLLSGILLNAGDNRIIVIGEDLEVELIEPDVYRVIHSFPFGCNSLLVKVDTSEFILVDTPFHNQAMRIVHEWIVKEFGDVKLKVINGHFHGDCLGGNAYCEEHEIPTYGSYLSKELLETKGEETHKRTLEGYKEMENQKYYNLMKDNVNSAATNLYKLEEGLKFTYPNEEVEIFFPGQAHAPDNIVVYFKNKNVLFGGCMIKSFDNNSKGYVGDANFDTWAASVKKVMDRFGNAKIVMPGHGNWGDKSLLQHTYNIFK